LGETVVRAFLDAGYKVAGAARAWKKDRVPEGEFLPLEADLTTAAGCDAVVTAVLEQWGRLDAAVHLMGGFAADGPIPATSEETWDRMMALNAKGAFLTFRAVLKPMMEAKSGRVVAVGSRAGVAPGAGLSAYSASKAALHALVLAAAEEARDSGVTVNAVLPGTIDTHANRTAMPRADFGKWVPPAALAAMIVHLASEDAAHVNGALIPVYGRS
jgi:NAD(P)-dependent dehydrogenase (short-subunit alcohol dehydrogenase family)